MPKHSLSGLEAEIAGLSSDDPARRIHPLRQAQIKQQLLQKIQSTPQDTPSLLAKIKNYFWDYRNQFMQYALLFLGIIVVGGLTTAGLASAAMPGDKLYGLKIRAEKLQLMLTLDEESRAEMQAKLLENRSAEQDYSDKNLSNKEKKVEILNSAITDLEDIANQLEKNGKTEAAAKVRTKIEKFEKKSAKIETKIDAGMLVDTNKNTEAKNTPKPQEQQHSKKSETLKTELQLQKDIKQNENTEKYKQIDIDPVKEVKNLLNIQSENKTETSLGNLLN